ncbi:MAG TPA: amino acid permease [Pyrinomonadaceae bacterium]|nr:amino acid permease [Pyrinomonadaceae bacterium]
MVRREDNSTSTLARTLNLRDLILLIVGTVIGSGIFVVPSLVLRQTLGGIAVAMLVWLGGGILSMLGALTYGELTATNPKAGGLYVFIRDCFGPLPAFLYGWTLFFVISSGSLATLAVAFSGYLNEFTPLSPLAVKLVALSMIAVVTVVNVTGTRRSARVQNWTTVIKVAAILVLCVVLLWLGSGFAGISGQLWPADDGVASILSGVGLATISVLWAYEGWQYVTFSAGEVINAQRNYPRALLIGSAFLIGIYLLANLAYLSALGPHQAAQTDSIAATAITAVAGPATSKFVTIAILISILGAANGITMTAPRVYYAMARDGLFFDRLAQIHPRFKTPAFAVMAGSLWAAILAVSGTFEQLLTYVVFTGWIFYALAGSSIFIYRRRVLKQDLPYRVPGYPWTPLLFVVAAVALVANTIAAQPGRAAVGLGIVFLGTPAYFIWRGSKRNPGS